MFIYVRKYTSVVLVVKILCLISSSDFPDRLVPNSILTQDICVSFNVFIDSDKVLVRVWRTHTDEVDLLQVSLVVIKMKVFVVRDTRWWVDRHMGLKILFVKKFSDLSIYSCQYQV